LKRYKPKNTPIFSLRGNNLTEKQKRKHYNKGFYVYESSTSESAAKIMIPLILKLVNPKSVVDVGCGSGRFIKAVQQFGVTDVLGIDGPWAKEALADSVSFKEMDLANPTEIARTFDLAISLEVAEHLPEEAAMKIVKFLTTLAPVVMFSAAILFQCGQLHINEQWQSYWANYFAMEDYVPIDVIRPEIWKNDNVPLCYRQNTLVYVNRKRLESLPNLSSIGPCKSIDIVHPDAYLGTYMAYGLGLIELIKKLPKPLRPIARYSPNKNIKKINERKPK
jgi:SAM-dependent methyltransferase